LRGSVVQLVQNAPGPRPEHVPASSELPVLLPPEPLEPPSELPSSELPSELASEPASELASVPASTYPMQRLGVRMGQKSWQQPFTHPWPFGQTTPQPPQFVGSLWRSEQIVGLSTGQGVRDEEPPLPVPPSPHGRVQTPLTQLSVEMQALPQAPQLLESVERS
jgi:hypothetical protein